MTLSSCFGSSLSLASVICTVSVTLFVTVLTSIGATFVNLDFVDLDFVDLDFVDFDFVAVDLDFTVVDTERVDFPVFLDKVSAFCPAIFQTPFQRLNPPTLEVNAAVLVLVLVLKLAFVKETLLELVVSTLAPLPIGFRK